MAYQFQAPPPLPPLADARTTTHDPTFDDLPWYRVWVLQQVRDQPQRLLLNLPEINWDDDASSSAFFLMWDQIRELILTPGTKSIDRILSTLASLDMLTLNKGYEGTEAAKDLIFAIIGWQTMLYLPDPLPSSTSRFRLLDETDGYRGEARLAVSQPDHAAKKNLAEFLLGFGMMLPPPSYCAYDDADDQALFARTRTVNSKDLNAHVLTKVCGLTIHWVDSLSTHLELDRISGKLFLYRYPSFCVSALAQQRGGNGKEARRSVRSVLHRFALEKQGPIPWGTEEDATGLLQEILLSYRLLFGQNKKSRDAFRKGQTFSRMAPQGYDKLLAELCGRKRFDIPIDAGPVERDEYDLAADFPHLRSRLARLNGYAASKKPRSIRQVWRDRRDSTAWLAYWSVLVLGSVGVVLALVQTVFQVLQYVAPMQQGG